jgi:hypothetical protein
MPRAVGLDRAYREAIDQRRAWTPALLRPALWLDAADLSTISTATGVSQLRDKSGNGRDFTQGTGGAQPTPTPNGLNGRNVLSFNGSQWLTSVSPAATWNFLHNTNGSSVFAVWKAGNIADPNVAYGLMGTNAATSANIGTYIAYDDRASAPRNNGVLAQVSGGGSTSVSAASADNLMPANTPVILSHIADPNNGTPANRSFVRVNKTLSQINTQSTAPSASNASFALQIGALGNNVLPLVGYIAEIVVLASVASTQVRQQIEGHLAWKWGLRDALTAGHPFANRPPLIGG